MYQVNACDVKSHTSPWNQVVEGGLLTFLSLRRGWGRIEGFLKGEYFIDESLWKSQNIECTEL